MRFGLRALLLLALLTLTALLAGTTRASAPSFVMVDLGTLGGSYSEATGISPSGQVVGYSTTADDATGRAFSWTEGGGMTDVGTLGGSLSIARAVTPSGQIVGESTTAGDVEAHVFSWTRAGGMVDLGTLGGPDSIITTTSPSAYAVGTTQVVSPSGQIVGASLTAEGAWHAFSWTQSRGMVDLGTLGGPCSWAQAVNPSGQVVGYSDTGGKLEECTWRPWNPAHAFSWTPTGGLVDLGTLGGSRSYAVSVTPSGQVFGTSSVAGDQGWHAFSWTQADGMVDLGTLGGRYDYSFATAANPDGQLVGWSYTLGDYAHAFSWTRDGGMVDIGPPALVSWAQAVSPRGQVVGGRDFDGLVRAFSWTRAGGMVVLDSLGGGFSDALAVNAAGQIAGVSLTPDDVEQHAVFWRPAAGQYATRVLLTFTSEISGRTVTWDVDVPPFELPLERRADGVLVGLNSAGASGDPTGALTVDLTSLNVGRLISGSLTATRDGQRISAQKMIGLAYSDRVEFFNRATYHDGHNTLFGDLTVRVTANG